MAVMSQEKPNVITVTNSIMAFDLTKKSVVPYTYGITIKEVKKRLQKRGISDFNKYQFLKYYRINMQVENIGNTIAYLTKQKVSYLDSGKLKGVFSDNFYKPLNEHESNWSFFGLSLHYNNHFMFYFSATFYSHFFH